MEAQLEEGFLIVMSDTVLVVLGVYRSYLLMHVQFPEDLRGVKQVLIFKNPDCVSYVFLAHGLLCTDFLPLNAKSGRLSIKAIQ